MIHLEESTALRIQPDILSGFKKKTKKDREIGPDMDISTLSDIISDRLIAVVKKELNKMK